MCYDGTEVIMKIGRSLAIFGSFVLVHIKGLVCYKRGVCFYIAVKLIKTMILRAPLVVFSISIHHLKQL